MVEIVKSLLPCKKGKWCSTCLKRKGTKDPQEEKGETHTKKVGVVEMDKIFLVKK